MSTFVESLKRLYSEKHYITVDYINSLKEKNKITQEEYDYIVQEEAAPTAQGTAENPIVFKVGMEVNENYYYADGTKKYVCIKKGFPAELAEGEYFTEL